MKTADINLSDGKTRKTRELIQQCENLGSKQMDIKKSRELSEAVSEAKQYYFANQLDRAITKSHSILKRNW